MGTNKRKADGVILDFQNAPLTKNKWNGILIYREFNSNAVNKTFIKEARSVLDNATTVENGGIPDVPIFLLVSDGKELSAEWNAYQEEFAVQSSASIEHFNCGHYIHHFEPETIADLLLKFILTLH